MLFNIKKRKITSVLKTTVFFLFMLNNNFSFSQNLFKEKLINYSYIINGKDSVGFITVGTGSIIHFKNKNYLLTNFHVLTGKDCKTNKKVPGLRDTNTSISIIYQPLKKGNKFLVYLYPIYKKNKENFTTLTFKNGLADLSIMPIEIPKEALLYSIKAEDIDTNCNKQPNGKIFILGFPKGKFINQWQPTELDANSITNPNSNPALYNPYIFFDILPIPGMSGSPVYHYDLSNNLKLLSVVSNQVGDIVGINGRSICAALALVLIRELYSKDVTPIKGLKYQYK